MPHCESPPHGVGPLTTSLGKLHSQARRSHRQRRHAGL